MLEKGAVMRGDKWEVSEEDDGGRSAGKLIRMMEFYGDKVTRQTKMMFPCFDGNIVQEWLLNATDFSSSMIP